MTSLISNLLEMLRVKGTAYFSKNVTAPWGLDVGTQGELCRFHIVLSGSTWVGFDDASSQEKLEEGDFVIVPRGKAHFLDDIPGRKDRMSYCIPDANPTPKFERLDKENEQTHMLCGYFEFIKGTPPILTSKLPDLLVVRQNIGSHANQIKQVVELLRSELSQATNPHQVVLNRLTEILLFHAVRQWVEQEVKPEGALHAFLDPRLESVFDEIHLNPANSWTVQNLAKIAGQSRTSFATSFKQATGLSPISYITTWRMEIARKLLKETDKGLDEISAQIGYMDTNAFSRAFKHTTGASPAQFRRSSQQ